MYFHSEKLKKRRFSAFVLYSSYLVFDFALDFKHHTIRVFTRKIKGKHIWNVFAFELNILKSFDLP